MKAKLALTAALGLVAMVVPGASAVQTEITRYKGEFVADRGSAVEFVVRTNRSRPRSGGFTARNFTVFCDGDAIRWDRFQMDVKFHGRSFFEGDLWEFNSLGGKEF